MTYQEEKQVRIRRQSSKHAIALAMQSRWREAIEVNKNLIESFPNDTDAYNRLGKAYMEIGEYQQAEEAYRRAFELDHFNVIARKNLNRLSHISKTAAGLTGETAKANPHHFIEETGKSRVFSLHRPAPTERLARMVAGDTVYLKADGSNLVVENGRGEYLGLIEPKYGHRLIQLIQGGNKYSAAVVNSSINSVSIIIREVYQDPSQLGMISFTGRRYEEVQSSATDKVFKDSTEYGGEWGIGEGMLGESTGEMDEVGGDKADHEV